MEQGRLLPRRVYDVENAKRLLEIFEEAKDLSIRETSKEAEIIFGQFPAIRAKTVNFIADKVPGIKVPKEIIDEMNLLLWMAGEGG